MLANLKKRAKGLKHEITALAYAFRDPAMPLIPKLILGLTIAYALSPIDLIPDFIPILGYLDDILILPALISLSLKLIPPQVMEAARARAEREPIHLGKNRIAGAIFILIWIAAAGTIVMAIYRATQK